MGSMVTEPLPLDDELFVGEGYRRRRPGPVDGVMAWG